MPYRMLLDRFDFVIKERINPEVYIDGDDLESLREPDLQYIKSGLDNAGLLATIHGPFMDLNPGSTDESKRLLTVVRYRKVFKAVRILKPRGMVLHAGFDERDRRCAPEVWITQSMKTWPEFARLAEEEGVIIALENIFDRDPAMLKLLVEMIASPNVGICLDTGHLNVFASARMEEWFNALGPYVRHLHIHDNHGDSDEHLPVGDGVIDFKRFFGLVKMHTKEPVVYTIEPHGEDRILRAVDAVVRYVPVD